MYSCVSFLSSTSLVNLLNSFPYQSCRFSFATLYEDETHILDYQTLHATWSVKGKGEQIGRPPFKNFSKGLWKCSVWLAKFGGKMYNSQGTEIFKGIFSAPEYSLLDKMKFFRGSLFSVKHLHQELLLTNLKELVNSIDIPVYFFLGKHDYSAPYELAQDYFERLKAPRKKLIWFEKSGHMPHYKEKSKYVEELINVLKEQTNR